MLQDGQLIIAIIPLHFPYINYFVLFTLQTHVKWPDNQKPLLINIFILKYALA
ncbi:hypothetical protein GPUN_0661 [Glaciecola punicea ACAM 611]|uniref:Uncharacterized protein n=1 Tax=Glaciecola punicea ACAM 611 TaxID=1121923 RepID=H5T924_9ALTE|nr:hypothetical protein GPUN_0661 [Glaciecola punicea ACAM 611]